MHITEKGQVTIPLQIREKYGFLPHGEVEFIEKDNKVYLKPMKATRKKTSRGRSLVEHLRGRATVKMSTEEIMRLTRGDE